MLAHLKIAFEQLAEMQKKHICPSLGTELSRFEASYKPSEFLANLQTDS